jgi:glutathione S-transferase
MGRDAKEKAIVEMWERRAYEGGIYGLAETLRNTHPAFADRGLPGTSEPVKQIPELADRGRARLARFYASFDRQLATNRFVAGPEFTVADITAFCVADFMKRIGQPFPAELANLARWYDEVAKRPSAKA